MGPPFGAAPSRVYVVGHGTPPRSRWRPSTPASTVTSSRLNPDGSPQVTLIWVGRDGNELLVAHLGAGQKMRNIERDPRVAL